MLTKKDIEVINKIVTDVVTKSVTEMAEVILNGVSDILKEYATKKDLEVIKSDIVDIKHDIRDLKADLPSNADIESLKRRVTKLESH